MGDSDANGVESNGGASGAADEKKSKVKTKKDRRRDFQQSDSDDFGQGSDSDELEFAPGVDGARHKHSEPKKSRRDQKVAGGGSNDDRLGRQESESENDQDMERAGFKKPAGRDPKSVNNAGDGGRRRRKKKKVPKKKVQKRTSEDLVDSDSSSDGKSAVSRRSPGRRTPRPSPGTRSKKSLGGTSSSDGGDETDDKNSTRSAKKSQKTGQENRRSQRRKLGAAADSDADGSGDGIHRTQKHAQECHPPPCDAGGEEGSARHRHQKISSEKLAHRCEGDRPSSEDDDSSESESDGYFDASDFESDDSSVASSAASSNLRYWETTMRGGESSRHSKEQSTRDESDASDFESDDGASGCEQGRADKKKTKTKKNMKTKNKKNAKAKPLERPEGDLVDAFNALFPRPAHEQGTEDEARWPGVSRKARLLAERVARMETAGSDYGSEDERVEKAAAAVEVAAGSTNAVELLQKQLVGLQTELDEGCCEPLITVIICFCCTSPSL